MKTNKQRWAIAMRASTTQTDYHVRFAYMNLQHIQKYLSTAQPGKSIPPKVLDKMLALSRNLQACKAAPAPRWNETTSEVNLVQLRNYVNDALDQLGKLIIARALPSNVWQTEKTFVDAKIVLEKLNQRLNVLLNPVAEDLKPTIVKLQEEVLAIKKFLQLTPADEEPPAPSVDPRDATIERLGATIRHLHMELGSLELQLAAAQRTKIESINQNKDNDQRPHN